MSKNVIEVVVKVKDQASKGLDKFAGKLGISKTALAGMAAAALVVVAALKKVADAVWQTIKEVAALGDSFDKMSKRTGQSVDTLTKWVYSAELAGGNASTIENSFRRLTKSMYDAQQGLSTATRAFDNLGVSAMDSEGNLRDANDVMMDLAEAFQRSTNKAETMAIAQDVLGRGGLQMVAVLEQGKAALQGQADEYDRLRDPMSETSTLSAEMVDSQLRLTTAWDGAKAELVDGFMPAITETTNKLASMVGWTAQAKGAFDDFMASMHDKLWQINDDVVILNDLEMHYMMLTQQANAANAALKDFSMPDFVDDEVVQAMVGFNEQLALFNETVAEGVLLEEDRLGVRVETIEATDALVSATEEATDAEKDLANAANSVQSGFERLGAASLAAMYNGNSGAIMFGRTLRTTVVNALTKVIAKLLIIKALSFGSGMLIEAFGIKDGGSIPDFASGGGIPNAAAGYAVPEGKRGMDSVLINAMPGEHVITRSLSQRLAGFLAAQDAAAMVSPGDLSIGSGGGVSVALNVGRPVGYLDYLDMGEAATVAARKVAEANL